MPVLPKAFFETRRLVFRPFQRLDIQPLHRMLSDPEVYRYVGDSAPLNLEDAGKWVANSTGNVKKHGFGTGAVVLKSGGNMIGWGGFARSEGGLPEIIYGFARAHWGNGFATELIGGLIRSASGKRGPGELRATVDRDNAASVHLLTKHGFALVEANYLGEDGCDLYVRPLDPAA